MLEGPDARVERDDALGGERGVRVVKAGYGEVEEEVEAVGAVVPLDLALLREAFAAREESLDHAWAVAEDEPPQAGTKAGVALWVMTAAAASGLHEFKERRILPRARWLRWLL